MTPVEPLHLLLLTLLGGWAATDSTSFGQFMISRPLVAASLAGWIVGNPAGGAMIGLALEAFHLGVLPVGAARYPEPGPAAVVAGAAYASAPPAASLMLLVLAFALVWERVGGQTVHLIRQLNVRLVAPGHSLTPGELQRRHLLALAADYLRGVLLTVVGWGIVLLFLDPVAARWALDERLTALLMGGVLAGLIASSGRVLGGRARWFAAGLIGGLVLVLAGA